MRLSQQELQASFSALPPVLSVDQAAKAIQVPVKTLYEWSSKGFLKECARRRGKRLLILRDKFLTEVFNGADW